MVVESEAMGCVAVVVGGFVLLSDISVVFATTTDEVFITTISENTSLAVLDVDKRNVDGV